MDVHVPKGTETGTVVSGPTSLLSNFFLYTNMQVCAAPVAVALPFKHILGAGGLSSIYPRVRQCIKRELLYLSSALSPPIPVAAVLAVGMSVVSASAPSYIWHLGLMFCDHSQSCNK